MPLMAAAAAAGGGGAEKEKNGDGEEEEERYALSTFPRCVNGIQYHDVLREGYAEVWAYCGVGQRTPESHRRTCPNGT